MTLAGLSVLLAEDNPTNQMVATQMLESLGADVTLAIDGAEALEILDKDSFDVALIDIQMPRVSGIEVISRLRKKNGPHASMPLIALTAYVMREHRAAIDDAGADGVIPKPILSIEQLGDDIISIVNARRQKNQSSTACAATTAIQDDRFDLATFENLRTMFAGPAMEELLDKVMGDIGAARTRVEAGLASQDVAELRGASHVLISVGGAIGATGLQKSSQSLNSAAHGADNAAIARDGQALLVEIDGALDFVRGRLKE